MFTTVKLMGDSEVRARLIDLQHDYCDDKLTPEVYIKQLEELWNISTDLITRSQIAYRIVEVKGMTQ